MRTGIITLAALFLVSSASLARPSKPWTYQELNEQADLVVIGVVESVEAFPEPFDTKLLGSPPMKGRLTTFKAVTVLKGKPLKSVELVHFIIDPAYKGPVFNGPDLPTFRTGKLRLEISSAGNDSKSIENVFRPKYLLFLKRRPDGKFQPVSGYVDSAFSTMMLKPESSLDPYE